MRVINIKEIEEKNYEEGAEMLKEAGYVKEEETADTNYTLGDITYDEWWVLRDEDGNEVHRVSFVRYYDGEITTEDGWVEKGMIAIVIAKIKEKFGISRAEMARRYKIPVRTLQDWALGKRQPPAYVAYLLERVVELEGKK